MKSKHLLLFLICCLLLYVSDFFAGPLIAIGLIYQLNLLLYNIPLTRQSQLTALKLFIYAIPLFLFLGGVHSFTLVYFHEAQWLFFAMALIITSFLFFLVNLFCFYVFNFIVISHLKASAAYQLVLSNLHKNKKSLIFQTFLLLLLSFFPLIINEWKIIFSLMVMQVFHRRSQLKRDFGI